MRQYSEFFQTIYDEHEPSAGVGRGTHYSVLRARDTKFQEKEVFFDFLILWDEDHDTRVIEVLENLYNQQRLRDYIIFAERKGCFYAVLPPHVSLSTSTELPTDLTLDVGSDTWSSKVVSWEARGRSGIINAKETSIIEYIERLSTLWSLPRWDWIINGLSQQVRNELLLKNNDTRVQKVIAPTVILEDLFGNEIFLEKILRYCDDEILLKLRLVSIFFNQRIKQHTERQVPYANKIRFTCSVAQEFPLGDHNFSKERALTSGYSLYQSVKVTRRRAFIEPLAEKYFLFNKKARAILEPEGTLIEPKLGWTPEVNDCWVLSHIHRGNYFHLLADPSFYPNFWDATQRRPTALGRELFQIMSAGYTIMKTPPVMTADYPFLAKLGGMGVILFPAPENTRKISLLRDVRQFEEMALQRFLGQIIEAMGGRFSTVESATGRRIYCDSGHDMRLLWEKYGEHWCVIQKCQESTCGQKKLVMRK
jgi:hypothetical protein